MSTFAHAADDAAAEPLFPGFFVGGFECSSHRLPSGRRLDMATATRHVEFADADYRRLADNGIVVARDGFAWDRVEATPGRRDFGPVLRQMRAARRAGVRVIWDLMHFGWPDAIDVFTPAFVEHFATLARDFAVLHANDDGSVPWISPVNEISFLSWAGADVGVLNPFDTGRGFELKCQLVRASIAAIEAVRDIDRRTRIVVHDPAFNVVAAPDRPDDAAAAEASRLLQFQACDLLSGRAWPQLGGRPDYLDVIGVNYYPWNQWEFGTALEPGAPIVEHDPRYRPVADLLCEWHARYGRPIYVGETGCEGAGRADWLRTIGDAVAAARARGAGVHGICLYPIVDFPGWDNERHCENGLWDYADDSGHREICAPFLVELRAQQRRFAPVAHDAHGDAAAAQRRWPLDPEFAATVGGAAA